MTHGELCVRVGWIDVPALQLGRAGRANTAATSAARSEIRMRKTISTELAISLPTINQNVGRGGCNRAVACAVPETVAKVTSLRRHLTAMDTPLPLNLACIHDRPAPVSLPHFGEARVGGMGVIFMRPEDTAAGASCSPQIYLLTILRAIRTRWQRFGARPERHPSWRIQHLHHSRHRGQQRPSFSSDGKSWKARALSSAFIATRWK